MKRNQFFNRVLCLMGVALMASLTLVSCNKKDDVNPDDNTDTTPVAPTQTGNFVVGTDTTLVSASMLVNYEGFYQIGFFCKDGTTITMMTMGKPAVGTSTIVDLMSVYFGQAGYYIFYYGTDDEEDIEIANGTVTVTSISENNINITFTGKTDDSVAVSFTYNGSYIDMTQPMGTGSFTINGETFTIDRGAGMSEDGLYEYDFMDGNWENSVYITSIEQLKSGKTYTIVSDETETLLADQVTFEYGVGGDHEKSGSYSGSATSGTLQCSINGETYTLTISGTSSDGNFTCTYAGKLPLFSASKNTMKQMRRAK